MLKRVFNNSKIRILTRPRRLLSDYISLDAEGRKGWELVLYRATNIVKNTADGQHSKILHVLCSGLFYKSMGNVTNFEMEGCSDVQSDLTPLKGLKQYYAADLVDVTQPLPYDTNLYHYAVCLYPVHRSPLQPLVPMKELIRVVNEAGFILVGARESYWPYEDALKHFEEIAQNGKNFSYNGMRFLTMQQIALTEEDLVTPGSSNENVKAFNEMVGNAAITSIRSTEVEEKYWLAVLKRGQRKSHF